MSLHKGRIERGRELLVAKSLISNINNKATGNCMFNKSELLETYPEGFRWNWVKMGGMKPDVVWMRGTCSRRR